jgi:hypothetical protein
MDGGKKPSSDSDTDDDIEPLVDDNNNNKKHKLDYDDFGKLKLDPHAGEYVVQDTNLKKLIEGFEPYNEHDARLEVKVSRTFDIFPSIETHSIVFMLKSDPNVNVQIIKFLKLRFDKLYARDLHKLTTTITKTIWSYEEEYYMHESINMVLRYTIRYNIGKNNWTLQDLNEYQKETNTLIAEHIALLCKELFPPTNVEYAYNPKELVAVAKSKIAVRKQGGGSSSKPLDLTTTAKVEQSLQLEPQRCLKYKLMSDNVLDSETWKLPDQISNKVLFPPTIGEKFKDINHAQNIKTIIQPAPAIAEYTADPTYLITVGALNMVDMTNNNNNNVEYNDSHQYTAFTFFQRFARVDTQEHTYSTPILLKLNCPVVLDKGESEKEPTVVLRLKF